jgi:MFS family permease
MPSLLIISSRWYDKSEQAFRFIVWFTAVPVGQIIGGLLSFGFQHISEDSDLPGWRIMFLVMGAATIVIGILTILLLPDTPMKASWLSEDEKVTLLKHVSTNKTGVENSKFRFKEIREALVDSQVYLLCLCVTCVSAKSDL